MQGENKYVNRNIESQLQEEIKDYPAVAILGPRQCGKSTLAINLKSRINNFIYLDLEKISDVRKIEDPELFFKSNRNNLVCLDEIQNIPELFPALRSILDENDRNGQILILGSASRDLIKQTSETLAGRISYIELTPFLLTELYTGNHDDLLTKLWLRGGFPRSYLASDDKKSLRWRYNFTRTYLERDIPQLGFNIPSATLGRLWQMCAHFHGKVFNSSSLGESLGMNYHTVRKHVDLLEQTFVLRILKPFEANLKKRLIKSPKIYIRDSGILHSLLEIESFNDLLGHPVFGYSWEGFVIENILSWLPDWRGYFYRTSAGSEIDLVLEKGMQRIAVECKASTAPQVSKGFWIALDDLNIKEAWVIAPVKETYPIRDNVSVAPLETFLSKFIDRL